jgi:hypothetical protein
VSRSCTWLDFQDTSREVHWAGIAFALLIAGALFSAASLLDVRTQRGWVLAAVVTALGFAAFAISRTTGLPGATGADGHRDGARSRQVDLTEPAERQPV